MKIYDVKAGENRPRPLVLLASRRWKGRLKQIFQVNDQLSGRRRSGTEAGWGSTPGYSSWNLSTWKREMWSARVLWTPLISLVRKTMLCCKEVNTRSRTNAITNLCFDVCWLMMSTKAALSVRKMIHLSAIKGPHIRRAITMGKTSQERNIKMFSRIRPRAEKPMLTKDSAIAFGAKRIRKQFKGTMTVPLFGVEKGFTVEIL